MSDTNMFANYADSTLMYLLETTPDKMRKEARFAAIAETWLAVETEPETREEIEAMAQAHRRMEEFYQRELHAVIAEQGRRDQHADEAAELWAESRP